MTVPPILYLDETERSWLISVREEGRQRVKYSQWLRSQYHIRYPTPGEIDTSGIEADSVPDNSALFVAVQTGFSGADARGNSYYGVFFIAKNSIKIDFEKLNAGAAKTLFIRCMNYTGDCHVKRDEKFPNNL